MKRDLLKDMNLSEEQIDKIMSANGNDIENAKGSAGDVEAIKQENDSLKSQITERDKDIKGLKKQAGSNDELTKQFEELQNKYETDTQNLQGELQSTKLNGALDSVLNGANVRNAKAAKALLNMDDIKLNDKGELEGVGAQLDSLKKSDSYLFDEGTKTNYDPKSGGSADDNDSVQSMVDVFKNGN